MRSMSLKTGKQMLYKFYSMHGAYFLLAVMVQGDDSSLAKDG